LNNRKVYPFNLDFPLIYGLIYLIPFYLFISSLSFLTILVSTTSPSF